MPEQTQQPYSELASFGEELRREREIRGISLKEIADATKISKRFLEAIERNDHRTLPAPVFTRGFIREYARYLGLNADEIVNRYNFAAAGDDRIEKSPQLDRLAQREVPPKKGIPPPYARIDRNVYILLLIVAILAAASFVAMRHKRAASEAAKIEAMYVDLLDANVDVVWVPDLNSLTLLNHSVKVVDGLPAIYLNESPLTSRPTAALSKSLMEKSVALLAIILLSPVLLLISLAVKLSSPGPVFFKQDRHGWNGKVIQVWKFRSMRVHDDRDVKQASRNDSRITAVGRFIRRTSLDELPQLFNVLQGHMALVGPRPHAVAHNNYYSGKILAYMARHRIKPGITGLAQISGCRGETDTLDKMEKRVEIDLKYINNWSLWLDVKILVKTPFTLLSKDIY